MAKQEGGWPAVCDVLIRGAVQHEQLDFVAAALMERARKHEHVPPLAAQAAKYAEEKYNSTQLVSRVGGLLHTAAMHTHDSAGVMLAVTCTSALCCCCPPVKHPVG